MKNNPEIILVCKGVIFYSQNDENAFFEWIKKIPSIIRFDGIRDELYLYIKSKTIPNKDLDDLIALFHRYKVKNIKQLALFLNKKNQKWFYENKEMYWHKKIFGSNNK